MTTADGTSPRRGYHAPRRAAMMQETRQRVREAARDHFLADGYAGTTIRAIARSAGVAEKTVYLQFATKTALLKEVVETAIVGDDDPVPAAGREWFTAILEEQDAGRKLALMVDGTNALHERTGELFAMARGAAAVDPDAARLWRRGKEGNRADMTTLATSLVDAGLVPRRLGIPWATSVLYVLLGPETWHLMRVELDQDESDYRQWLLDTLTATFRGVTGVGPT